MSNLPNDVTDADMLAALGAAAEAAKTPEALAPTPKAAPAEKAEEPAAEEPVEAPAEEAEVEEKTAAPTANDTPTKVNVDRVVERLFGQYQMSPDVIDAMDDAERLKTADALALKVLKRAAVPQRFIDAMSPEERVAEAIPLRVRQRQQDRAGSPVKSTNLNGEGRTPQPQARAVAPVATDPLAEVGDELDLLDPAASQKVRGGVKQVQDELAAVKSELALAHERVRASNFADAFVAVLEESPSLKGQHQAIRLALNDSTIFSDEDRALLDSGGDGLVELVRRAAEDHGYVPQSPAKTPKAPPVSQARNTPPKPSARGGTGRAAEPVLTDDQKQARIDKALMMSGFDENKARQLLASGKVF